MRILTYIYVINFIQSFKFMNNNQDKYAKIRLSNQLCFPLYACAKEVVNLYKPYLEKIDLTYTQYITMMVLWECHSINTKELGKKLLLDSGTLTPLLNKLANKGLISKQRDADDARNLIVTLTDQGIALADKAIEVPQKVGSCLPLPVEELMQLKMQLDKMLETFQEK